MPSRRTTGYVSRIAMKAMVVMIPLCWGSVESQVKFTINKIEHTAIAINQNAHLHPACWIKTPPTTRPTIGLKMGPKAQKAIALPLISTGIKSAIVPLPQVIAATTPNPARNRNVISMLMFLATAQPIVKMKNKTLQVWYTGRRP